MPAQLGVPPNCVLLSIDGRNLNAPYREVVATLATMPATEQPAIEDMD